MGKNAVLTVLHGGAVVKTCPLAGEVSLGRAEDCVIRLEDRAVSRLHAVFRVTSEGVMVEKKSAFTPLVINGAESEGALLKEGDLLSVGSYLIRIGFVQGEAPESVERAASITVSESEGALALSADSGEVVADPLVSSVTALSLDAGAALEEASPSEDALSSHENAPLADSEQVHEAAPNSESFMELGGAPGTPEVVPALGEDAKTQMVQQTHLKARLLFPSGGASHSEYEIKKDEITIGRGKKCDIVLNDKKSSRVHAIIKRVGMRFFIKDLDSANGTFVNNIQVVEQELSGDEMIRVGDVDFRLEIMDSRYAEHEKNFLPASEAAASSDVSTLPEHGVVLETPVDPVDNFSKVDQPLLSRVPSPQDFSTIPGVGSIPGMEKKNKSLFGDVYVKYVRNFRTLNPRQQIIFSVFLLTVFYFFFFDSGEDKPAPAPKAKASSAPTVAQKPTSDPSLKPKLPLGFELLDPEKQRFIEAQHSLAFDHYKNKEYDKALYEIRKIFAIVPDYKNAKELERYATEGKRKLEAIEEEQRKKEEEMRMRAQLDQLIEQTKEKMAKKEYDQARELISQVLASDPDNMLVSKWRSEIQQFEDSIRVEGEKKRVRIEVTEQIAESFAKGVAHQKKGQYHLAIEVFKGVRERARDFHSKFYTQAQARIVACQRAIVRVRGPLLQEAKGLEESGEYSKAYQLYQKASRVDRRHPAAQAGLQRIRGLLHEKAKAAYTEGVLAESYSDFATSRRKFQECLEIAPPDDIYYQRAQSKLSRYFQQEGGGGH